MMIFSLVICILRRSTIVQLLGVKVATPLQVVNVGRIICG
jgi:hypothetical protein